MKFKTLFYMLPHAGKFLHTVRAMRNQKILATREHLKLCGEWFLNAQEPAGGYAASFSFIQGLSHAYIETSGYIVPTMFDLAAALSDERCRESALRAGQWLLTVQRPDGAFPDIDRKRPVVFDTGQVMLGLNRLYRETRQPEYLEAARRGAAWLAAVQDPDGSWTSAGYHPGDPCVYLSRTAAAMLDTAQLAGEPKFREAGEKFLRWAATRQQPNGFFLNCELIPGDDPVLHTLVYVLEGYLMAYQYTGGREWLDILLKGALPLRQLQLERDLVLRSQYNAEWKVTNPEKCIPGLAQWAALCLALFEITKDAVWREAAQLSIYYLKSKQLRGRGILHGALPASVPVWGHYQPMMLPNWAVKFFADALLLYDQYGLSVQQEQEGWVQKCFQLHLDGGSWEGQCARLEPLDEAVCTQLARQLEKLGEGAAVLDLGCGRGRFLKHLAQKFPALKFVGVDASAEPGGEQFRRGTAHQIPLADATVELVYVWLVLQHVDDLSGALQEIRRVLKQGGTVFIGDRDKCSGRGLLKVWHELSGRWMYPWDSPFLERWYFAGRWKRMISAAGFRVVGCRRIQDPQEHGWRRLAHMNQYLLLKAEKC
jgi:ubiquinone/menaquinone biosynthesis C-methylase UbiE